MAATSLTSALVGREAERERILASLTGSPRSPMQGVLIAGERGTGCTWLSRDVARTLAALGWQVHRLACSPTTRDLPYGSLAHVLSLAGDVPAPSGDGALDDPEGLITTLRRCRSVLEPVDQFAESKTLLVADDIHHVDPGTCAVLVQLLRADGVLLLGTTRPRELSSPVMQSLDQATVLDRCDLGTLDRSATAELAESLLGAPLDGWSTTSLFEATGGLPLAVSEVTRSAHASGALTKQHGLFHLEGTLTATPIMTTALLSGVEALSAGARRLLRTIAVAKNVPLEPLESEAMLDHLLELDAAEWIVSETAARGPQVRMRSAAARLALAGEVSLLERRALLRDLTTLVESSDRWRRSHPLQLAAWRVDAGLPADQELLIAGARQASASHDYGSAAILAELATREAPNIGMNILRAEALHEIGNFAGADRLLRETEVPVEDEPNRLHLAVTLHRLLLWGQQRPEESAQVLAELRGTLTTPTFRDLLLISEANVMVFDGQPQRALDLLAEVDRSNTVVSLATEFAKSIALMFIGQPVDAAAIAADAIVARESAAEEARSLAHPLLDHLAMRTAQTEIGLLDEAYDGLMAGYAEARAESMPQLHVWFTLGASRAALYQGRIRASLRLANEARRTCEELSFVSGRRMCLNAVTVCAWLLGDREGALAAHAELLASGDDIGFYAAETALGHAAARLADDDPAGACEALRAGAELARSHGEHLLELELLWEVARDGEPASVLERLDELGAVVQGDLAKARVAAAHALHSGDPDQLEAAEHLFAACGAWLNAAELAERSGRILRDRGLTRDAGRVTRRAAGHRERCDGPTAGGVTETVPALSEREREVALLIVEGLSSKEIATKLTVSVRTVSNHLQSIYLKLGISRRADLADALASSG